MADAAQDSSASPSRWALRPNLDLLGLLILCLLLNAPFFATDVMTRSDSTSALHGYYYFYNGFFFDHDLPLWLPYGLYGMPSSFTQIVTGMSPISYLTVLLGSLLGVRDAFFAFKISMVLEQLVYVLGLYALARRLIHDRRAVLFACVAGLCSLNWLDASAVNQREVWLLPWVIYSTVVFWEDARPSAFWLAGTAAVLSSWGSRLDALALLLLLLVLFSIPWLIRKPKTLLCLLRPSRGNLSSLMVFVLIAGLTGLALFEFKAGVTSHRSGVSLGEVGVGLEGFLTWPNFLWGVDGGGVRELHRSLVFGDPRCIWSAYYCGLASLPALGWAAWRRPWGLPLTGLLLATGGLFWLAHAGLLAAVLYEFPLTHPLFSVVRFLPFACDLLRVPLVLCAAFGVQDFLAWLQARKAEGRWPELGLRHMGLCMVSALFLVDMLDSELVRESLLSQGPGLGAQILLITLARCLVYLLAARLSFGPQSNSMARWARGHVGLVLLGALLFDVGSYRAVEVTLINRVPATYGNHPLEAFEVDPLPFTERRRKVAPKTERQRQAATMLEFEPSAVELCASFSQLDECSPQPPGLLLWFDTNVETFLRSRSPQGDLFDHDDDPALERVLGCRGSKVRLVRHAVSAPTNLEALDLVKNTRDLHERVIVTGALLEPPPGNPDSGPVGQAEVSSFSANRVEIEARVLGDAGAWLIYADAYHPRWRATVNGQPAPIYPAYTAFKAVKLGPGRSVVTFTYHDPKRTAIMVVGVLVGLLQLIAIGFALLHPRFAPRKKS